MRATPIGISHASRLCFGSADINDSVKTAVMGFFTRVQGAYRDGQVRRGFDTAHNEPNATFITHGPEQFKIVRGSGSVAYITQVLPEKPQFLPAHSPAIHIATHPGTPSMYRVTYFDNGQQPSAENGKHTLIPKQQLDGLLRSDGRI